MESNTSDYRISFFKPTTPIALYNRNLVVWLVCIWVVTIFGFQIALKLLEKPTPEPAFTQFEQVWPNVLNGSGSDADWQGFAHSCLSVLGKNFITEEEKAALDNGLSFALTKLASTDELGELKLKIADFENQKASITDITQTDYVNAKNELAKQVSIMLGLGKTDVRKTLVAQELTTENWGTFTNANQAEIPTIMSKYLIHNQSFLTDFKVLGFPFHYFYASIFLLILFIGLCWLYCIRIDRRNVILGIDE